MIVGAVASEDRHSCFLVVKQSFCDGPQMCAMSL